MNQRNSIWLAAIPATRLAALMAGLPHLLYALVKSLPIMLLGADKSLSHSLAESLFQSVQSFPPTRWLLTLLAPLNDWNARRIFLDAWQWAFALLLLGLLIIAWRGGWPHWAATTLGYMLVVTLETSLTIWREDRLIGFSAMIVLTGYVCLIIWLARRDPLAGLLCIVPFYPMFVWWTGMDRGQGDFGGLYWIFIGLGMAAAVSIATWRGSLVFGMGVLVIAVLGLGMGYAIVYPGNISILPPLTAGEVFRSGLRELLAFAIVCLPLWLTLGWQRARRSRALT